MKYEFIKMNGAGNDFIIFDARKQQVNLTAAQVMDVSARSNAITKGCDQLIILEKSDRADVFMRIYNADSSEVDACGNATRCIAYLLEKELGRLPVTIETNAGVLQGVKKEKLESGHESILVDMGAPKFGWQDIPLSMPTEDAVTKVTNLSSLKKPVFVSMGNPHVVFFMDKVPDNNFVTEMGSKLENCLEIFPRRANISFAAVSNKTIHCKVWERGAGLTAACGTAACAMLAAYNKLDDKVKDITVIFDNSDQLVSVKLEAGAHILLGGAVEVEFEGVVDI